MESADETLVTELNSLSLQNTSHKNEETPAESTNLNQDKDNKPIDSRSYVKEAFESEQNSGPSKQRSINNDITCSIQSVFDTSTNKEINTTTDPVIMKLQSSDENLQNNEEFSTKFTDGSKINNPNLNEQQQYEPIPSTSSKDKPGEQITYKESDTDIISLVAKFKLTTLLHNKPHKKTNPDVSPRYNVARGGENEERNIPSTSARKIKTQFNIFKEVAKAIETGDLPHLKQSIKTIYKTYDKALLSAIYCEKDNPIRNTHLITLACKHREPQILDFLLNESDILQYLPNKGSVVEKAYKEAFCETIVSFDTEMLEMLYDYWSGDVHWPISSSSTMADIIPNLEFLRKLLIQSRNSCQKHLGDHLPVAVKSLIVFNNFQIELYKKLLSLKVNRNGSDEEIRKSEVEAIRLLIVTAFKIYEKTVNTKHIDSETEYANYYIFEVLYRKLDSNIALLILNNLHLLKQRLILPKDAYQDIECALYYFLYEVSDKWSLFLRRNKQKENEICDLFKLDKPKNKTNRFLNQPIIYYKWIEFRKAISHFVSTLGNVKIDVEENLRSRIPKEEINSLTLLPYLRDDYSLKKMLNYMKAIGKIDFEQDRERGVFIVQRVIQVLGELVKHSATHDTCHLSPTTRALLQSEIPKHIVKIIEDIRDSSLSRARQGTLIRRIDLELNEHHLFEDLITDLFEVKKAIKEVISLYKPVLDKNMYRAGIKLLDIAYEKLEEEDNEEKWGEFFGVEVESWGCVSANATHLREMRDITEGRNLKKAATKIPIYTCNIQQKLKEMKQNNENWNSLKKDLTDILDTKSLSNYPTKECFQKIRDDLTNDILKSKSILNKNNKLKLVLSNKSLQQILNKTKIKLKSIYDFSNDWKDIVNLLKFFVEEVNIFQNSVWEIKYSECTRLMTKCAQGYPDAEGVSDAFQLVHIMKSEAKMYQKKTKPLPEERYEYSAIRTLSEKLKTKYFLTKTESDYLLHNIPFSCSCVETSFNNKCDHCLTKQKIKDNETLSAKEHTDILSLNISEKCRKTVVSLVKGKTRGSYQSKILECLLNRAHHLDKLLEGCRDHKQLVFKYKFDQLFRIVIEILICDVMNAFQEGWLKELANVRFSKMLSDLPLRNIIEHGNPLLEVVGSKLDPNDFPNALISFTLDFLQDRVYLQDLFKLYEEEVDRHHVYCSTNLSPKQLILTKNFKKCSRWKSYIKLLPTERNSHTGDNVNDPEAVQNCT